MKCWLFSFKEVAIIRIIVNILKAVLPLVGTTAFMFLYNRDINVSVGNVKILLPISNNARNPFLITDDHDAFPLIK